MGASVCVATFIGVRVGSTAVGVETCKVAVPSVGSGTGVEVPPVPQAAIECTASSQVTALIPHTPCDPLAKVRLLILQPRFCPRLWEVHFMMQCALPHAPRLVTATMA